MSCPIDLYPIFSRPTCSLAFATEPRKQKLLTLTPAALSFTSRQIRGQNVVSAFRDAAGPWDVDMAKELRPNSIRGMFGKAGDSSNDFGGARTGVHCTDLAEDGPLECRYFFELMQGV